MALEFEWDPVKAELNLKEHGVSFDEATTIFRDTLSITTQIQTTPIMGMSHRMQLLVVSYTERKNKIRIISARRATRAERKNYEETD